MRKPVPYPVASATSFRCIVLNLPKRQCPRRGRGGRPCCASQQQLALFDLDPAFADMNILRQRRDGQQLGAVLSNSFGFGGTNATLIFKHIDA